MPLDPALVAVVGALTTVSGLFYRALVQRAERAERDADFWRDRALDGTGLAEIAADVAEGRTQ